MWYCSNLFSHIVLLMKCLIPCEGSSWTSVLVEVVTVDDVFVMLSKVGLQLPVSELISQTYYMSLKIHVT